jgi:hypothetical protein
MMRTFAAFPAFGTLVIVVPTADGLVIAADSRTRMRDALYDGREKLHVAGVRSPIAFAVTGAADFPDFLPEGRSPENWLQNCTYAFRSKNVVQSYLSAHNEFAIDDKALIDIGLDLAERVSDFFFIYEDVAHQFHGKTLSLLVLNQVSPSDDSLLSGSIPISIDSHGVASPGSPMVSRFMSTDIAKPLLFGEADYVVEHVKNGGGRQFVRPEMSSLWDATTLVRDMSPHRAADLSREIISAAERTSQSIPLPSGNGIGGDGTAMLVSRDSVIYL